MAWGLRGWHGAAVRNVEGRIRLRMLELDAKFRALPITWTTRMNRRILATALALGLLVATQAQATETVDNAAVIEMVKLGLDEGVIAAKIQSSRTRFDTSPKALGELKNAGVPGSIVQKMVQAGSMASAPVARTSDSSRQSLAWRNGAGEEVNISPVRVTAEVSNRRRWIPVAGAFLNSETFMTVQGAKARVRTDGQPAFVTTVDPLKVRLLHLADNKNGGRYVVFDGNSSDREINVVSEELGGGHFLIKPDKPLQAGQEYAFIVSPELPSGMGFWAYFMQPGIAAVAYDFGVQ